MPLYLRNEDSVGVGGDEESIPHDATAFTPASFRCVNIGRRGVHSKVPLQASKHSLSCISFL